MPGQWDAASARFVLPPPLLRWNWTARGDREEYQMAGTLRVYVAGPYSADPVLGTREAIHAADRLLTMGHSPYVPHLSLFWHLVCPRPYEDWLTLALAWVERCDCVLRLPRPSP